MLADAIAATFDRRRTPLPEQVPLGLTGEFARDPSKVKQWSAFLTRHRLEAPPLDVVVSELRNFLDQPLAAARRMRAA